MLTLKAETRDTKRKPENIRKTGKIPAVFYGKKEASTPITLDMKDFLKVWEEAGETTVISIETNEGSKESLIHDVDIDPVSGAPRHADFYVFEKGHKVEIELPIEFEGVSKAVKDKGGILIKVLHELKIEAEPRNLPRHITVDISTLENMGDQITAGALKLPEGVTLIENEEEVVALVSEPREEVEEEETPIDLSAIEVERKGKDDEGSEGDSEHKGEREEESTS